MLWVILPVFNVLEGGYPHSLVIHEVNENVAHKAILAHTVKAVACALHVVYVFTDKVVNRNNRYLCSCLTELVT